MEDKLRVLTVIGTRPEIIRLAETIKLLDKFTNHLLVHTGQNHDYELNQVFFENLGLRSPDYFLDADTSSLGTVLGSMITAIEPIIIDFMPDAFLILGDTNSSMTSIIAKRLNVPVFHMEAGNRSFDQNVPEETNRRLVDHISDYNLVYSAHARRNLLAEGIHPSTILLSGSPVKEVLEVHANGISQSNVLQDLNFKRREYILVSLHRQENVDDQNKLLDFLKSLDEISDAYSVPILLSTHPRTRNRINELGYDSRNIIFHKPFGFFDYIQLQINALIVLSDSGTISEESSILGFPAISLREAIERPEAVDTSAAITTIADASGISQMIDYVLYEFKTRGSAEIPEEYLITDFSRRVVSFVMSKAPTHHKRNALTFKLK